MCQIPCLCPLCHLNESQCSEHKIEHGDLFNEKEHAISIRSSEELCTDKEFFKRSYILKYSGIPINCPKCKKDLLYHHSYHIKYHKKCRFCKQSWFKYKAETELELKYLEKKEIAYFKAVCPHCDKQFCESYQLKMHTKSEHTSATFKCKQCEKGFQSAIAKTYHEKLVHETAEIRVHCDLCQKTFASDFVLKNHQKYAHSEARNESCPYCAKKCKQKKTLRVHLASIHDVDRMKETYGEESEKKVLKCADCDSTFGYKKNLNESKT